MQKNPVDPIIARKPTPLVMVNVRMTREQYDFLMAEGARRGTTFSALVRGVLADFQRAAR